MAPTLGTGVSSLPPEGSLAALGRPGGGSVASMPLLQVRDLTVRFGAKEVVRSVNFSIAQGEKLALVGENGAGKSTLVKIIYGSVKPDVGEVNFNGTAVHIRNPQEARELGISMVFQHFSLFETLTVAENVWLGLDKKLKLDEVTQRINEKAEQEAVQGDRPAHQQPEPRERPTPPSNDGAE